MGAYLEEWEAIVPSDTTALSRLHPEVAFDIRPVGFRWVVRCTGSSESLDTLTASADRRLPLLWVERSTEPLVAFAHPPGPSEVAFLRRVGSTGGLVLPPLMVRDGITRVRVLVPSEPAKNGGRRPSATARLVARRRLTGRKLREEIERLAPGRHGLTPQQSRVLLEAVRAGYYEVPRRTTVGGVARRLSLGRSTAEEHLRAAESTIVSQAAPLIELSSDDYFEEVWPREHVTGFSSELELYVDLALRGDRVTNVRLLRSIPPAAAGRNHPLLRRVLTHLHTGREDLSGIPVELHVSPFERKVLEEVRRIPPGETRSYGEIARRIGSPGASRAVGNAVAHNPAPLVIPCHRVVPQRGGIGNYSATGGTRTKQRLLTLERAIETSENDPRRPSSPGRWLERDGGGTAPDRTNERRIDRSHRRVITRGEGPE